METERFGQAFTNSVKAMRTRPVNGTQFINAVRDLMVAAGWTLVGGLTPWMSFWTAFLPTRDCDLEPLPVRPCGGGYFYSLSNGTFDGLAGFFDPNFEMKCSPGLAERGCTLEESVINFGGAMTEATGGTVTFNVIEGYPPNRWESDGPDDLSWPREAAQIPLGEIWSYIGRVATSGTAANGTWLASKAGSGFIITGDRMWHGGWILQSQSANGRTQYRLEISEEVENYIRCRFRFEGEYVDYWLLLQSGLMFDVIANPYQIAIFCEETATRDQGFFASAPYLPEDRVTARKCILIIGANPRGELVPNQWGQTLFWNVWSQALDGPLHKVSGTGKGMPNIPNLRHGSAPVLTPDGFPVAQTPWVQMSFSPAMEGGIVGQLWDAVVMSDWYPHDQSLFLTTESGRRIYRRVCSLTSYAGRTPCSLWLALPTGD